LQDILASGRATAIAHAMLGIINAVDGHQDRASVHLGQAYRLDPGLADVVAALIELLRKSNPPDAANALAAATAAARNS